LHELARERKDLGSRLLFARARLTVELRSSCQDSISVEQTIIAAHSPTVEGTFAWNSWALGLILSGVKAIIGDRLYM
jgi:hypothetical protein